MRKLKSRAYEKLIDYLVYKLYDLEQRSQTNTDMSSLSNSQMFRTSGFDTSLLEGIITKNSVAHDFKHRFSHPL